MVEIFVYFVLKSITRKLKRYENLMSMCSTSLCWAVQILKIQKFAPPKITRYTVLASVTWRTNTSNDGDSLYSKGAAVAEYNLLHAIIFTPHWTNERDKLKLLRIIILGDKISLATASEWILVGHHFPHLCYFQFLPLLIEWLYVQWRPVLDVTSEQSQ